MAPQAKEIPHFPGFPDFKANVTFVPIQFFTVVVPHCSRGTVRIVGYTLRKLLGWVDEQGNPTREQLQFTYRELIEKAGVSRDSITEALREAEDRHLLRCVQSPEPDREDEPGRSGIYELCWDKDGPYTDNPEEFRGFYYPEAAVVEVNEGSGMVKRPKAARKNIPNAFFDHLLPRERLSIIRVVGALLFYSIQWGQGGERRVPVCRSITELSRLAKLSRQHVHAAVMEAQNRGYIEPLIAGFFDTAAGRQSRATTYGIKWMRQPVENSERDMERSEKVDGAPVGKDERNRSERVNGERSEMVNDIRIKKELKNKQTTAAKDSGSAARPTALAADGSGFDLLRKEGFDEATAKRLADGRSLNAIQRQIQWLKQRTATRNKLGFLRRAIEQDWPEPEGAKAADSSLVPQARTFANHYYASYHNFSGESATEPFPKDINMATKYVSRLLAQEHDLEKVPEWGRRFGRFMRERHHGDSRAKPNLSFALVLYGDKFLRLLHTKIMARQEQALGQAREAHQKMFLPEFICYLRQAEEALQQGNQAAYETFTSHRARLRGLMTAGPFLLSAERVAQFDSERGRLLDLGEFFQAKPNPPVLDFWRWDARLNPRPFIVVSKNADHSAESHT